MNKKIALVTGGSRGLGKEMALRLAEAGHHVVITYLSQKEAALSVVGEIEKAGGEAAALFWDAGDFAALADFVEQFKGTLRSKWRVSTFDFLVNNAGMGATIPFAEATGSDFDRFVNVHFKSVYFLTQQLLPSVNDGGRIINISSGTTRFYVPGYSIYSSLKGAVEVFTQLIAREAGARGITANVIAPGPVETDFNNGGNRDIPERKKAMAARTALGRVGVATDIGGVAVFLCSPDSGWITGQRIEVSGGINL